MFFIGVLKIIQKPTIYKPISYFIINMEKKYRNWLIGIFLITLTIKIILAFTVPNFTYESYFSFRQIEHIQETGLPLFEDNLSYGGREFLFLPLFYYFYAILSFIIPLTILAKILPNIFVASIIFPIYFISKKIYKNETAALLSSFIAGFLPILFLTNSFVPETIFLPLIFLTIYSFLNIKEKKHLYTYIFSFLILSLTSSSTFLLIVGFGIYLLLSLLEQKKVPKTEIEVIIFSLFFYIWTQFLFFKEVLIKEGISFVWQNIPTRIITQYFPKFSLGQALVLVSIIPFLAGIYVAYRSLFQLKNQKSFLLISFVISTSLLTWARLIQFKLSLAFFGIILAILFSSFYLEISTYFKKTKFPHLQKYLLPIAIILISATTVYPAIAYSLNQDTPTDKDIQAFQWLNENTEKNSGVLAMLKEGHLITYYSERRNLMDDKFDLIDDVEKRSDSLISLFTTKYQTQAVGITDQFKLKYLVLSPDAKERYKIIEKFPYATKRCFELVYKNETEIYRAECKITNE